MKQEILVNVTSRETRAALVDDGIVQEVYLERATKRGLIGNIYRGKVSRVLPGMQAAFIDIGLQRTAFLHESDIERPVIEDNGPARKNSVSIRNLVTEGGEILVQVLKDPLGSKGARLTTCITIPSRYLVYMPGGTGIGVSVRIENETERDRLRALVSDFSGADKKGGYIVRTAAEGAEMEAVRADMMFLKKLWEVVEKDQRSTSPGNMVHEDLPLPVRILRDLFGSEMERVRVDSKPAFERMQNFAAIFVPELKPKIELYAGDRPIFDLCNIEDDIQKAMERKVPLKSGGHVIIDQTEAMTTIDVNTGAYVGHRNLEETIYKTNLEAALTIARQLRLRNLGGIIIIDFIDMDDESHRDQVLQSLEKHLARDHAKSHITHLSPLGLVEMTRKRTRESLENIMCTPCPTCSGSGTVKTPETVCYEIFREILRQSRQFDFSELMVLAHPEVVELLLDEESSSLAELGETTGKTIRLQSEGLYSDGQYDVVLM